MNVFDNVVSRFRASKPISTKIEATPEGAVLYLDGRLLGTGPRTVELPEGQHYIHAVLEGYERSGRIVDIKKDGQSISFRLSRAKINSKMMQMVYAAVNSADVDSQTNNDISLLSRDHNVDEIIVLRLGSPHVLIRYEPDGTMISSRRSNLPLERLEDAHRVATELLSEELQEQIANLPLARWEESKESSLLSLENTRLQRRKDIVVVSLYSTAGVFGIAWLVSGLLAANSQSEFDKRVFDHDANQWVANQTTDQLEAQSIARSGKKRARAANIAMGLTAASLLAALGTQLLWSPFQIEAETSIYQSGRGSSPPSPKHSKIDWSVWPGGFRLDF